MFTISDTSAAKKENLQIQKSLSKLTPGIDENVRYILYSAYNKRPSGSEEIDHFEMTEKLQEARLLCIT